MLKPQWWVNCKDMAAKSCQAVRDGTLEIVPKVRGACACVLRCSAPGGCIVGAPLCVDSTSTSGCIYHPLPAPRNPHASVCHARVICHVPWPHVPTATCRVPPRRSSRRCGSGGWRTSATGASAASCGGDTASPPSTSSSRVRATCLPAPVYYPLGGSRAERRNCVLVLSIRYPLHPCQALVARLLHRGNRKAYHAPSIVHPVILPCLKRGRQVAGQLQNALRGHAFALTIPIHASPLRIIPTHAGYIVTGEDGKAWVSPGMPSEPRHCTNHFTPCVFPRTHIMHTQARTTRQSRHVLRGHEPTSHSSL